MSKKNNTEGERRKVLISLLRSPSPPVVQRADSSSTENRLPRYAAWPIYHIDQLVRKSDVHGRLAVNAQTRAGEGVRDHGRLHLLAATRCSSYAKG